MDPAGTGTGLLDDLDPRDHLDSVLPLLGDPLVLSRPGRGLEGDVDVAVERHDPLWPLRLGDGWRLVNSVRYEVRGWCWFLERGGRFVALDVLADPTGLGQECFPTSLLSRVPDPVALRAAYLAGKRLRKRASDDLSWRRISELGADPAAVHEALTASVGERTADLLLASALSGRAPAPDQARRARQHQRRRRVRGPGGALLLARLTVERSLERVLRPTGLVVLVVGPDGAGKSTVADALLHGLGDAFTRSLRVHWLPRVLPVPSRQRGDPADDPHGRPPDGRLLSLVRLSRLFLDAQAGHWAVVRPTVLRTGLVVVERGWWDMAVDPRRYRLDVPPGLVRALGRLLPSPDVAVVLHGDVDVLLSRKHEISRDELVRQQSAWRAALPAAVPTVRWDTSRCAPADVVQSVADLLERRATTRLGPGWAVLPSRTSARWVVPRGPRRVSVTGLRVYHPVTLRGLVGWGAARALAGAGATRLLPRGEAPVPVLRALLADVLPAGATVAVSRSTHPDRYVALVVGRDGRALAVAKLGTSEAARQALQQEEQGLGVAGSLPAPLTAPAVLASMPGVLLLTAVDWRCRARPWRLPVEVAAAMGRLARTGAARADGFAEHGDFAPWNLLRTADGWCVLDWETASRDGRAFADVCHYVTQSTVLLGHPAVDRVVEGFVHGRGWVGEVVAAYADEVRLPADLGTEVLVDQLRRAGGGSAAPASAQRARRTLLRALGG